MFHLLLLSLLTLPIRTEGATDPDTSDASRFGLHGYGVVNYFAFDWETDPARRNALDLERLVLYPSVRLSERVRVEAEVEIEHGGTGATLEFDRFEEFGEFEQEIEAGGEVVLEQLHVHVAVTPAFNIRVGRLKLPIGLASTNDEPNEYFTTTRSSVEANLIPTNWYEIGAQAYGQVGRLAYNLSLTNGLDGTGFSSANWVQPGYQTRFETVNAEDLALALRLDYLLGDETLVGLSAYGGNTTGNRPKPDLAADAYVGLVEAHGQWVRGPLTVRGMALYGGLQNADLVSQANRNLSNNLGVKRTPVGSAALGAYAEAGYNVLSLLGLPGERLDVFGRLAFYDSMYRVTSDTFDNPRWERTDYTGGLNYRPIDDLIIKAEFTHRVLGTDVDNVEDTFSLGLGFEF